MDRPLRSWIGRGAALGIVLFLVNNVAVWSGWLFPPPGYHPLFHLRNQDTTQYLAYIVMAKDRVTFPILQAPWQTSEAYFFPLLWLAGKVGSWFALEPATIFQGFHLLIYIAAGIVFVYTLRQFLKTKRQVWLTLAFILCSIPISLFIGGILQVVTSRAPILWTGAVEYAYTSADGLFRGGLSNSPTLTFGTAALLAALALTARRIVTGRRKYTAGVAAAAFLCAFCHPFEAFVIVPASMLALLLLARRIGEAVLIALAAGVGLAPYLFLSVRNQWLREIPATFEFGHSPVWILSVFGLPVIFTIYLLLVRAWPRTDSDRVLLIWWLTTIAIFVVPLSPFPPHLVDGFVYVNALLAVRLMTASESLRKVYSRLRAVLLPAGGAILAISVFCLAVVYAEMWKDGRSAEPALLLSTVAHQDESAVVTELRNRAKIEDLVLAPEPLAMLLVCVPVHSFASHEHLAFNYPKQSEESRRFFNGQMSAVEASRFLDGYGVRWVVMPDGSPARSYFAAGQPVAHAGRYAIYLLPQNRMNPYPGLKAILPPGKIRPTLGDVLFGR